MKPLAALAVVLGLTALASAQQGDIIPLERVVKSQRGSVSQKIANTDITIVYGRPVARGRTLFGSLVPYGRVWHPGADAGSTLETTRDIQVNGHPLPKGKYSLWTLPGETAWTFMFSKEWDAFHTSYPGQPNDALRLEIKPETGAHMETLSYYFPVVDGKDATLRLHWGTVIVPLAIKVQ